MKFSGEDTIPADIETVWAGLNNPDVLREAIPGCESFEAVGENQWKATVVQRIGPMTARFSGAVELSDLNPPQSYTLSGSGSAGALGAAKGAAKVALTPVEGGTRLAYDVDADVTGKIAQLGARLMQSTAASVADSFFKRFGEIVSGAPEAAPKAAGGGLGALPIVIGALVVAAALAYFLLV